MNFRRMSCGKRKQSRWEWALWVDMKPSAGPQNRKHTHPNSKLGDLVQATHSYQPARIHGTQGARQKAGRGCWEVLGVEGGKHRSRSFPKRPG